MRFGELPHPTTPGPSRSNNYVNELEKAYMATDDTPSPDDPTPPDEAWREVRDRRRP